MADINTEKLIAETFRKCEEAKIIAEKPVEETSKKPYENKYQATSILREVQSDLIASDNADYQFKIGLLSATINYQLGVLAFETEEFTEASKYLDESWEYLKENALKPECVIFCLHVLNQLGILWSGRDELKKACDFLKEAENLYGEYKLSKKPAPIQLKDFFYPKEKKNDSWSPLENALTLTLYYLAQVYEHLGENENSAKYCHITLKRQLESKDYEPMDWSLNCATLSQYFIAKEKLSAARHVLSCASHIISKYEEKLKESNEIKSDEEKDNLDHCIADIFRCWSKYALHILILSHENLLDSSKENNAATHSLESSTETDEFLKVYSLLKEDEIKQHENSITCKLVTNFDEAKLVFLFGIECLSKSKKYYVLSDHTYDYVQIIQDNSKLYKFLASFENDHDRKCKMHKRRIDMLDEVLKKLNIQFYLAICRQLMFELAETSMEMMDLKLIHANSNDKNMTPHAVKKINFLASKSIEYYTSFIDSLRDAKKILPETFADDVVRPALVAYFCLGRLNSKIICSSPSKEVEFLKKTETCYKFIVDYIEKNPQHETTVTQELAVIKDMLELIPGKIQSIFSSTLF